MPIRHNDIKAKTPNMIHFVIALHCEAQPVIQHYQLKPAGGCGKAQFFEGEHARLAVTGVGALSSAIGATALGERYSERDALWVNVSICGTEEAAIGTAFLANRIRSDLSRETYYPQLPRKSPWPGMGIKTLSAPSVEYQADCAFEMEGFGFYTAALAFATSENIHCIKIVSDNAQSPATDAPSKPFISQLIADRITEIATFAEEALSFCDPPKPSHWAVELQNSAVKHYRFTETERHQLARHIAQLDCLTIDSDRTPTRSLLTSPDKTQFLTQLQTSIDRLAAKQTC